MIIAIDCGIRGTGVAVFSAGKLYPEKSWCLTPDSKRDWTVRLGQICEELEDIISLNKCTIGVVEQPMYFRSSTGIASAARGDLVKLSMIAGACLYACLQQGLECTTVLPQTWKGRRKKEDVHKQMMLLLPDLTKVQTKNHNTMDAIGIGLWYKGAMKNGKVIKSWLK